MAPHKAGQMCLFQQQEWLLIKQVKSAVLSITASPIHFPVSDLSPSLEYIWQNPATKRRTHLPDTCPVEMKEGTGGKGYTQGCQWIKME